MENENCIFCQKWNFQNFGAFFCQANIIFKCWYVLEELWIQNFALNLTAFRILNTTLQNFLAVGLKRGSHIRSGIWVFPVLNSIFVINLNKAFVAKYFYAFLNLTFGTRLFGKAVECSKWFSNFIVSCLNLMFSTSNVSDKWNM